MPRKREPTAENMRKAEHEIGENLPMGMIGEDSEDVRDVRRGDDAESEA